jgi:hypothetical protein
MDALWSLGWAWLILARSIWLQTMKAFMGRLMCGAGVGFAA